MTIRDVHPRYLVNPDGTEVDSANPLPVGISDGFGNPLSSHYDAGTDKYILDIHDADVHDVPVNELFHRHTGVATTINATVTAGDTSIVVVSGVGFANGDPIQIEDGVIETTFPTIISGGGTTTFNLDRPLDNSFAIGDAVDQIATNLAVSGTLASPVSFKILADKNQIWHIVRFLLGMIHANAADDSKFGSIPALPNGVILRGYNATTGLYRTFTNWKSNFDLKMDMYNVDYTTKAGGGDFGTNARGSIRDGTGAVPKINGANGDYLEILIQDDLTGLIKFNLKSQGHIEDI